MEQVEALADACEADLLAGIHLEGPWLSPLHRGAHDPANLRNPSESELEAVLAAGRGHIKMITIAPELPEAMTAISDCVTAGVVAAIGHTDADYDQTQAAIAAGATVATHLFNAMPAIKHRDPGPVSALIADPRVFVELIVDGVHLHPGAIRLAKSSAQERVILVTDAMAAAGAADGHYCLGPLEVDVVDSVARLTEGGAIAGSTLTMAAVFRNYVDLVGATVSEAVRATAQAPARMMGLLDRGTIVAGARADLCHLNPELALSGVWRGGESIPLLTT
jgi:N-acetylglucosamine-6-phosphate deacetylase